MLVSYQFSREHNFQSLLWDAIGAVAALVRRFVGAYAAMRAMVFVLWFHALADLAMLCAGILRAVGWSLAIVAIVGAVFVLLANPMIVACVAGIALFAYVTYPRSAKPARCPYCKGRDIDAQRGWAECRDCGKTWSY